ncbi:hypothetical protein Q5M85_21130 [Paraclostridium bifermentans]|nr:hypothetical protein [Paraclostridium bifermentans]
MKLCQKVKKSNTYYAEASNGRALKQVKIQERLELVELKAPL